MSMGREYRVGSLRALTVLSGALSVKLDELEIHYLQVDKALLYSLRHSLQVGLLFLLLFLFSSSLFFFIVMFNHFDILQAFFYSTEAKRLHRQTRTNLSEVMKNTIF